MAKKRAYIILGMKRSGHHAILHWICYNFKSAIHYNDYRIHDSKFIPAHPHQKPVRFGEGEPNVVVYNCEDFKCDQLSPLMKLPLWKKYNTYFSIVLRDPYNWIASSLKAGGGLASRITRRVQMYKNQYKIFKDIGAIPISYNRWVEEESYREHIGKKLSLPTIDKGVRKVSVRGGGSSFDKLKFKGDASKMDVFGRWKAYKNNPIMQMLLNDKELLRINEECFHINLKV